MRGCGLPDSLIEYLPSFRGDAIRFYSCFVSYSSKDQEFAERLHADLQSKGVKLDRPFTKVPTADLAIAFLTDPWGTYIELTEGLSKAK